MIDKNAYIRKSDGKWKVYSENGKLLGTHDTKEEAEDQLQAIHISQHAQDKAAKIKSELVSLANHFDQLGEFEISDEIDQLLYNIVK